MAFAEFKFRSKELCRYAPFNVILPNDTNSEVREGNCHYDREPETLVLLGGYGNSEISWIYGTHIMDLAAKYNLAVILPAGENSFYLDGEGKGNSYGRYIGMELVSYVQRMLNLPEGKEHTFIGGVSMGGYGAIHTGLAYPETFGKIIGFSSALIIQDIAGKKEGFEDGLGDYDYYRQVFGDLELLKESAHNPEIQIKRLKEKGAELPKLYLTCGTGDPFLNRNREFYEFLRQEEVEAICLEKEGNHDWFFWDGCLEDAVLWLLKGEL